MRISSGSSPGAQVAETTYTAFSGRWRVTARLIVRRIPDLRKSMADEQGVLIPVWRYHAVFTDSPFVLVQAEEQHRAHAVVEQLFAEVHRRAVGSPAVREVQRQQHVVELHRHGA